MSQRWAFPAFLLGSAILSLGPIMVRLADVGAVPSAFWRMSLALPALLALAFVQQRTSAVEAPAPKNIWIWCAGLFFAADLATWHIGIRMTQLANAALLANTTSFLFPLWGYWLARQGPPRASVVAMLMALVGIILLMGMSAQISARYMWGDLLCVLVAFFYTGYLVSMERARDGRGVFHALALSSCVATAILLPIALIAPGPFWPENWTPLIVLALGSQVMGQGLIIWALPYQPPLVSGLGLLIQPVITAFVGWIWFNERFGVWSFLGMALILAAIVMVRVTQPRSQPVARPE